MTGFDDLSFDDLSFDDLSLKIQLIMLAFSHLSAG